MDIGVLLTLGAVALLYWYSCKASSSPPAGGSPLPDSSIDEDL